MSKQEQVLILEPAGELRFKGPFTDTVVSELKLKNPSSKRVLFKVKTTAPKCYCVRPNSGIIEANSEIAVSVMLQPFDHDSSEKNKHKFMVQSLFAADGPIESQDALWKEALPHQLMDSKLRCVFESADGTTQNVNMAKEEEPTKQVYHKNLAAAPVPVKRSDIQTGTDQEKLNEQCRQLKADIQMLKEENERLRGEGLRLRRVAMTESIRTPPPAASSGAGPTVKFPSAVAEASSSSIPPYLYLFLMLLVGLLIGKLLL